MTTTRKPPKDPTRPGRTPKYGETMITVGVRLKPAQAEKLKALGGAEQVRKWIEKAALPAT
jgi:hypothetical protein